MVPIFAPLGRYPRHCSNFHARRQGPAEPVLNNSLSALQESARQPALVSRFRMARGVSILRRLQRLI
jgi:hypothetical protein